MHHCQPQPTTDPAEAAITEIATIFAEAILRMKSLHRLPSETSLDSPCLATQGLEFHDNSRLTVPTG